MEKGYIWLKQKEIIKNFKKGEKKGGNFRDFKKKIINTDFHDLIFSGFFPCIKNFPENLRECTKLIIPWS